MTVAVILSEAKNLIKYNEITIHSTNTRNDRNLLLTYLPTNFLTCKRYAFTLAEVLITLGIIGVVAAITLPNLIANFEKKETVTKLQKAISILNQAYNISYYEQGEPDSAFNIRADKYFSDYWAPYIKVLTYCSSYEICKYKSNFPFFYKNGSTFDSSLVYPNMRTTFYTPDGFLYIIFVAGGNWPDLQPRNTVLVDINGYKKPNTLGKDVFELVRVAGKGVFPLGYDLPDESVNSACINRGSYCAEKIRRDGWVINY